MPSRFLIGLIALVTVSSGGSALARMIDRVVAYVDDYAITQSEVEQKYREMHQVNEEVTYENTLQTIINRTLLITEAKKYRLESDTPDGLIEKDIDLKIRATVKIPEDSVMGYYEENREHFAGKDYEDEREEILRYLTEKRVNERLREQLLELRRKYRIVINAVPSNAGEGVTSP